MRLRVRSHHDLLLICAAAVAIHAAFIINRRVSHAGDFDISRELGRRFVAGEPLYAGGLHYPYMPAAAMAFAPLALVPAWLGFVLRYMVALACLAVTLRLLFVMVRPWLPDLDPHRVVVAATTLLLAAHYIVRDLDDSGPHLILLALLVSGLSYAVRGRFVVAALCVGLATAVKAPNGLLLAFFLWTRQTRLAAFTAAAITACMLAPMPWMGAASWYRQQSQWTRTVWASARMAPASAVAADSEQRIQNQALPALVARWARGWLDGNRDVSRWLARIAGMLVLLTVAWRTRGMRLHDPRWLPGASMVMIAALLVSPATWVQHLVLMIPALYLIAARYWVLPHRRTVPATVALAAYAILALILNREILGRATYLVLLDGGLHTIAMMIVLGLVGRGSSAGNAS
jgi:alpha-1,2-mannosyltransferase